MSINTPVFFVGVSAVRSGRTSLQHNIKYKYRWLVMSVTNSGLESIDLVLYLQGTDEEFELPEMVAWQLREKEQPRRRREVEQMSLYDIQDTMWVL